MDVRKGSRIRLDTSVEVTIGDPLFSDRYPGIWTATGTPTNHEIRMVAKVATSERSERGNSIAIESGFYEQLRDSTPLQRPGIKVLTYFGKATVGDATLIALERAEFSFDQLVGTWADGDEVREELCLRLAYSLLSTLLELDSALQAQDEFSSLRFRAHRDIKPANIFLVTRESGRFDVVLGDFGYAYAHPQSDGDKEAMGVVAPEQRGTIKSGGVRVEPSIDTDLWTVGQTLWEIYHHGFTPYRDAEGRMLRSDDEQVRRNSLELTWDIQYRDELEASRNSAEQGSLALAVARGLLIPSSGRARRDAARSLLAEITPAYRTMMAHRSTPAGASEFAAQLERARLVPAAAVRPAVEESLPTQGRDIVALAPEPRPSPLISVRDRISALLAAIPRRTTVTTGSKAVKPVMPVGSGRAARAGRAIARALLGTAVALGTAGLVATLALLLGWWQIMPLPSDRVDSLQRFIVSVALLAVVVLVTILVVQRWLATPPNRRRAVRPAPGIITGLLASGMLLLLVVGVVAEPLDASGIVLVAVTGLLAGMLYGRNPFRPGNALSVEEVTGSTRRARPLRPVFSAIVGSLGIAAILASVLAPLPASVSNHVVDASISSLVPGTPTSAPVFINPHSIAVNGSGDVAVVDRVGVGRDVVWIVPESADRAPYKVLTTFNWRAPEGVLATVPEPAVPGPVQGLARAWTDTSIGASIRSVESLDFLDEDTLLFLGEDGVTRLDFSTDGAGVRATRVTEEVTSIGYTSAKQARLLIDGSDVYVINVTPQADTEPVKYCDYTNDSVPPLWKISLASANPTAEPVMRTDEDGTSLDCIDAVQTIYRDDDGIRAIGTRRGESDSTRQSFRPDGSSPELLGGIPVDSFVQGAAAVGERFLIEMTYCIGVRPTEEPQKLATFTSQNLMGSEPNDTCTSIPETWKHNAGPTPNTFPSERVCTTGDNLLDIAVSGYHWQPLAVGGPDDTIYLAAQSSPGCTPIILKMSNDGSFAPVGLVSSQSVYNADYELGATAIMSAARPLVSNGYIWWYGPAIGRLRSGPQGFGAEYFRDFSVFDDRTITLLTLTELTLEMGSQDANKPTEVTRLSITASPDEGDDYTARLLIPGLTDMVLDGDDVLLARCGQILRVSQDYLRSLPVAGQDKAEVHMTDVIEGDVTVADQFVVVAGKGDAAADCTPFETEPKPGNVGLSQAELAPVSLSVRTGTDGVKRIYFGEAAVFGTQATSRVRVIDLENGTIRTIGFDPSIPAHRNENLHPTGTVLAGDLTNLGLVPTDTDASATGRVAVSTASATGTGPVLLIENNVVTVVDPGDGREVTGVAWNGAQLVITDGAEGDVAVLDLGSSTVAPEQAPWRNWMAQILSRIGLAPSHPVG